MHPTGSDIKQPHSGGEGDVRHEGRGTWDVGRKNEVISSYVQASAASGRPTSYIPPEGTRAPVDAIIINGLRARCIIGDEERERTTPQEVRVDLQLCCDLAAAGKSDRIEDTIDYALVSKAVSSYIEESRFHLVEALAEGIASACLSGFPVHTVTVKLYKKSHIAGVGEFGVIITRGRHE